MIKRTNVEDQLKDDLKEFSYCLTRVTRKWRFKVVARLGCVDLVGGSNDMVCSTAWNRDGDLFATAGISKRLCIYEVASVMQLGNAVHCPAIELSTSSKLSSISFNPYIKPVMASATYDGAMQIWDVQKGIETMRLKNHTKRVWSTEFSPILTPQSESVPGRGWCWLLTSQPAPMWSPIRRIRAACGWADLPSCNCTQTCIQYCHSKEAQGAYFLRKVGTFLASGFQSLRHT